MASSSNSNQGYNVADSNNETLNYIQELQTKEKGIFTNLEQNGSYMTEAEQNQLLNQMNDISQMRINLYQSLSGMNNIFQNALLNSRETLDEQILAIQIVENQLNEAKARLRALEEEKNNNIRNIQINDYYSERYSQHAKLMKIIVVMLIPIIILAFLNDILNKQAKPRARTIEIIFLPVGVFMNSTTRILIYYYSYF